MTVYLKPGMAFEPQKKLKPKQKLRRIDSPKRKTLKQVFNAFVISSLIILNITLIAVAAIWYLLVFSIFHPAELLDMYTFQTPNAQVVEEAEYTLEIVNKPPPVLEKNEN